MSLVPGPMIPCTLDLGPMVPGPIVTWSLAPWSLVPGSQFPWPVPRARSRVRGTRGVGTALLAVLEQALAMAGQKSEACGKGLHFAVAKGVQR